MRNLKVKMAYNGSAYHGYQSQNNALTIQDVVEERLSRMLDCEIKINGCSRTDTGVHAKDFCFNFHTQNPIPCEGLLKGMNAMLPEDIVLLSCEEVDESFHARFDCTGKQYLYRVCNAPVRDVFMEKLAFFYPYAMDVEKMNSAAQLFVGVHDFKAFCKAESLVNKLTTMRKIFEFKVERNGDYVDFYVTGDGFLHNMVRIMVGTLIYINEGKRTNDDILESMSSGLREKAGITLSPCGLYLNKVYYGEVQL